MITTDEFQKLCLLARLDPNDPSLANLQSDFASILGFMEKIAEISDIQELELANKPNQNNNQEINQEIDQKINLIETSATAIDKEHTTLKADKSRQEPLDTDILETLAPHWEASHFIVPSIINIES